MNTDTITSLSEFKKNNKNTANFKQFEIKTDSTSFKIDSNGNIIINSEPENLHFLNQ